MGYVRAILTFFVLLPLAGCQVQKSDLLEVMEARARDKGTEILTITDDVLRFVPFGTSESAAEQILLGAGLKEIPFQGLADLEATDQRSQNYRIYKNETGWLWPLIWNYYFVRIGVSDGKIDHVFAIVKTKSL